MCWISRGPHSVTLNGVKERRLLISICLASVYILCGAEQVEGQTSFSWMYSYCSHWVMLVPDSFSRLADPVKARPYHWPCSLLGWSSSGVDQLFGHQPMPCYPHGSLVEHPDPSEEAWVHCGSKGGISRVEPSSREGAPFISVQFSHSVVSDSL